MAAVALFIFSIVCCLAKLLLDNTITWSHIFTFFLSIYLLGMVILLDILFYKDI